MTEIGNNEHFSLNNIQQDIRRNLSDKGDINSMSANFRALQTNTERVLFAYELLEMCELLPNIINVEKCDEKSEERRKYGNHVFGLKRDHVAMKHYNKAVAYAKSNETLALAYGNRSAVLFGNKLYKECLIDIENALVNSYPENLQQKINERKQKALEQLEEYKTELIKEEYFTPVPELVGLQNEKLQCASDCIEMKSTNDMGRHIVATKQINPGDVIAIEKPYTNVLLYEFYLTHCHHCLRISYNLIPCSQCPLTLYCNEVCRNSAWERYHRYECTLLDTLHSIDATKLQLLALRVVLCAKSNFLQLINDSPMEEDNIYKSQSYKEIDNLITNEEHRPVNDLFTRSAVAAVMLHLLKATKFFEDFDGCDEELVKKYTADLLLKHLQTAPSNMHEISELQGNIENGYENIEIGAGAFAFMSLLNHSCSPNVVRHCHGTTMVLRALRPINIGQQLFDNYGYHHALMPIEERRSHLKDQYWFNCQCEACTNDWPTYNKLPVDDDNDKEPIATLEELNDLTSGSREIAQNILPRLLKNAKVFDEVENASQMEILDNQEVLKQCFAILGNKHTII